jgi:7,8-dihydropterin-6-yl-methyl-4-(beta-D-ribofuranosyl)aminobenzene 5'-phosphate synthase
MIEELRITVLAENTARKPDLLAEHGWAAWIEADGHRILFDTGQGNVLAHNAKQLDIQLDSAETVVISHGHCDHTGGLKDVLDTAAQADLYLHPAAMGKRYVRRKTPPHIEIGIGGWNEQSLCAATRSVTWTIEPAELAPGIGLTGEIPRRNEFEDTGGPFYRDESCTDPDPLLDDQALYIETTAGVVVVLGCAHAGVVNTLDYIGDLTHGRPIYAVLGGWHLLQATPERVEATIEGLIRHGVQRVGTAHCTGMRAAALLWSRLPEHCFECAVGSVFGLEE